jgi:hypothetical protein
MINDKPCNKCANFDPIRIGDGRRQAPHGRCAVQSIYLAVDPPGQEAPPGVKRAEAGELAKPHIVEAAGIVRHCALFRARP